MAAGHNKTKNSRKIENDPYQECRVVLEILDRIGDKWTVMAVGALANGPMRFNTIQRSIDGISHRMLTITLRSLEYDGLIKRTAYAEVPPRVEYELTQLGRSLITPLKGIAQWAMESRSAIESARKAFGA